MSETFKHQVERLEHEKSLPSPEKHQELPEHAEKLRQSQEAHQESLVGAREKVAELAKAEHETLRQESAETTENRDDHYAGHINSELKSVTLNRELSNIRKKLKGSERLLSKAIHQPVIRVVSEVGGRTISRPSGLLGGGILAFIGTTAYLYITKHVGLTYNYGMFLVLFAGGFALGIILELVLHIALSKKHA